MLKPYETYLIVKILVSHQFQDPFDPELPERDYSSGHHDYYHIAGGAAAQAFYDYSGSPSQGDGFYGYPGYGQQMAYYDSGTYRDDTYNNDPYYHG